MRKIFKGTIARVAIQCIDPRSGKTGTWLFTAESYKDAENAVSPLCRDVAELSQWCRANNWQAVGGGYIFGGAQ